MIFSRTSGGRHPNISSGLLHRLELVVLIVDEEDFSEYLDWLPPLQPIDSIDSKLVLLDHDELLVKVDGLSLERPDADVPTELFESFLGRFRPMGRESIDREDCIIPFGLGVLGIRGR